MDGGSGLDTYREALAAACGALSSLGGELWRAGSADLEAVMGEVDRVVALGEAARVEVAGEAMRRGEPGSGALALTPVQWVRAHAPSTQAGGAAQVVAVAEAFTVPGNSVVKAAVASGVLPVRSAAVVVAEAEKLRPLVVDDAMPAVLEGLVRMAVEHGPRGCRLVRPRLLATYGSDGVLQGEQDRLKRFVALSQPRVDSSGLAEYRLTLDVEGRAVLEAALGPLSAPRPVEGERDLRSTERRRGEGFMALVRRAVAAGGSGPTSQKTTLVVSVDLETLRAELGGLGRGHRAAGLGAGQGLPGGPGCRSGGGLGDGDGDGGGTGRSAGGRGGSGPRVRAGETLAGSEAGVLLAPETVRRLACDAAIVPVVLSGESEVVDMGRLQRLFTAGQVRRLWLRDRHCTYPGCDAPAQWCDAHHLVHWVDGGASDIENAGLLCERHHTVVHQRRYAGRVVHDPGGGGSRVEWDLTYDSYYRLLAARARDSGSLGGDGVRGAVRAAREPA